MKIGLSEILSKNRNIVLFSFFLSIPLTFTPNIATRIIETIIMGLFFWILSFIFLKKTIKKEEIDRILEIFKIRFEDQTFLPTFIILIITFLLCLIPFSLFFRIFFSDFQTTNSLTAINLIYLTYILLIPSFLFVFWIFIGMSLILTDIPISIILKFSKSDLSVFEWVFHRKIKNRQIYQAKNFILQHSFFTIVRTSFYYVIQVTSALYTLYYGLIVALGVEITSSKFEILMGMLALVIFVNTLFWNYYKRELFINELGLVEKNPHTKLIKKIDSSLFEKSLRKYFSIALVFSILSIIPDIPKIINDFSDYYDLILFFFLFPAFFILQSMRFYFDLKINNSDETLKNDLLRKNNIKTYHVKVQLSPIPHKD